LQIFANLFFLLSFDTQDHNFKSILISPMIKIFFSTLRKFFLLACVFCISISCFAQRNETKAIHSSFESYRAAVLTDNGDAAIKYIDSKTIQYYNDLLVTIKKSDSSSIVTLPFLDLFMALAIRHTAGPNELHSFDGKSLLIYAIENGLVGKNSIESNELGDLEISGEMAKCAFISNGQVTGSFLNFYRENEVWKMDLTSLFDYTNDIFDKIISSGKRTNVEFAIHLIETLTNSKVKPEVWRPVLN